METSASEQVVATVSASTNGRAEAAMPVGEDVAARANDKRRRDGTANGHSFSVGEIEREGNIKSEGRCYEGNQNACEQISGWRRLIVTLLTELGWDGCSSTSSNKNCRSSQRVDSLP